MQVQYHAHSLKFWHKTENLLFNVYHIRVSKNTLLAHLITCPCRYKPFNLTYFVYTEIRTNAWGKTVLALRVVNN